MARTKTIDRMQDRIKTRLLNDGTTKRYDVVLRLSTGKQKKKTFATLAKAKAWRDRNSTEVNEGTYRALKKSTFEEYLAKWKPKNLYEPRLKPATLNSYGSNIEKYLTPEFGHCQMTAIDGEMITDFEAALRAGHAGLEPRKKQASKSARNILDLLSLIFDNAKSEGYLRVNPMDGLKLSPLNREEGRALSRDEARKLLEQCDSNEVVHLVVLLGLLAGLRRNEIFALRWIDVDWANDGIHVRQNLFWRHGKYQDVPEGETKYTFHKPKTKNSLRTVDLSPTLKNALRTYRMKSTDKEGLIFQSRNGGPLDPGNFTERYFKPAVDRAQTKALKQENQRILERVALHTLRHSFGSWKLEEGQDLIYVSKQMGHARPSITADIYAHLTRKSRPEAAAKTDALLFGNQPADTAATKTVN